MSQNGKERKLHFETLQVHRILLGIEHIDDLKEDFADAFSAIGDRVAA